MKKFDKVINELLKKLPKGFFKGKKKDKKRIKLILALIEKIWEKHPYLRLCQLIGNCFPAGQDLYYLEDEELKRKLEEFYQPEVE